MRIGKGFAGVGLVICFAGGCGGGADDESIADESGSVGGTSSSGGASSVGGAGSTGGAGSASTGGSSSKPPPEPPESYDPCQSGDCWSAPALAGACGPSTVDQDFSSGLYNVHEYALAVPAGLALELTAKRTQGSWSPALIVHDEQGVTVHDGEHALSTPELNIQVEASGKGSDLARLSISAQEDRQLALFLTGWSVVDGGFLPALDADSKYSLTLLGECPAPPGGGLTSPPNFDPTNVANGYYLLPDPQPPGLYTHKADGCSRGTKLLIDVLYSVAKQWKMVRPALAPLAILDLNEGPCSTVDHATHDDGTHVDITAGCATQVACTDNQPAIDLAKLLVDTGQVCGILNNDTDVQAVVNAYFESKYSYEPWKGKLMRSVSGHTGHFHVRVKKPDGTCN